jgi:hypothetical protein
VQSTSLLLSFLGVPHGNQGAPCVDVSPRQFENLPGAQPGVKRQKRHFSNLGISLQKLGKQHVGLLTIKEPGADTGLP